MKSINETIKTQLAHRTIREFKDQKITHEDFNLLMEVARRTATSTGMQACSIIRITDPELKKDCRGLQSGVCGKSYCTSHFYCRSI